MAGPLAGKIAVVTGSSRGIGRGTAIALITARLLSLAFMGFTGLVRL